jgi:signal peptidase I
VKRILNWLLFATLMVSMWLVAGPTAIGGPASYVIVDGRSMEPTYEHGDLVIARERHGYSIGDVIVYDAPVDARFNVIHRVVGVTDGGYVTQGDNMERPDGWIAPVSSIYGSSWLHVPAGGRLITFIRQPAAILGLAAGLAAFEVLKRRERAQDEAPDVEEVAT